MALGKLGRALREAGRFEEGITAHQGAVTICHEIGGEYREGVALANLKTAQAAQQSQADATS